jgi:integrase
MARRRKRWGTGTVYQEPNGNWAIRWREATGTRRYQGGLRSKHEAERRLASIVGAIADGRSGLPANPRSFPLLRDLFNAWMERRKLTHVSWSDDLSRWNCHVGEYIGHLRASEVDAAVIRRMVEDRRARGLSEQTCLHMVRLLSTFFTDLCERPRETGAPVNPVRTLPKSTRRLMKPKHNPATTPYVKSLDLVGRMWRNLPDPVRVAYAIGVFSGLRPGEILGLEWKHIDFERKLILVRQQLQDATLRAPKDGEDRDVPIFDALMPELRRYRQVATGDGLLFQASQPGRRAGRNGTPARFMRPHTLNNALTATLPLVGIAEHLTWYQATKHTFATHFLINGGSIERLAVILGHSTAEVTKVYGHLTTAHITDQDRARLGLALHVVEQTDSGEAGPYRSENGQIRFENPMPKPVESAAV